MAGGGLGRRRLVAAALAAVLGLAGVSMVGYALEHQQVAPQPSVADTGSLSLPELKALPAPQPVLAPRIAAGLPRAEPSSIRIPAINVTSPVNVVGLNPDKTMAVPQPGPLYDQAAWYRYSPTPGEIGPSVIIGHIDSAKNGPSVFFKLGELKPGQRIQVTRSDGTTPTFEVDSVHSYPKDAFPQQAVYGDTNYAALHLITCGGSFDRQTRQYLNNTVVFAHLVR
ncbi:MAG: class F sortase [Actinomycetota bacterium]|nr:class F sortase [Actinomycetota bacterium]